MNYRPEEHYAKGRKALKQFSKNQLIDILYEDGELENENEINHLSKKEIINQYGITLVDIIWG